MTRRAGFPYRSSRQTSAQPAADMRHNERAARLPGGPLSVAVSTTKLIPLGADVLHSLLKVDVVVRGVA